MVAIEDFAVRAPKVLADGEDLTLGLHSIRWFDTAHVPHAWECALMMETRTHTFFCGIARTRADRGLTQATFEAGAAPPQGPLRDDCAA